MQESFKFGSTLISYTRMPTETNAVKITVEFEHGVEVVAPKYLTTQQLDSILHKKAPWIIEKLNQFASIKETPSPKEFLSGEKFYFLGRQHQLKVEERNTRKPFAVMYKQNLVVMVKPEMEKSTRYLNVRNALQSWYLQEATKILQIRTRDYEQKLNISATGVQVVEMLRRWGSCSPNGVISYNWKVVMAPMHIIDYLVVHELCHIRIADHSDAFWQLLASFMPDYEARREWLRVNGPTLTL